MRKKITKQVATASRNDAAPILRVFFELVSLEWVNLVANEAGNFHYCPRMCGINARSISLRCALLTFLPR